MLIDGKINKNGLRIRLGRVIINLDESKTKEFFRSIWKCGGYYIYRIGNQFSIYVDGNCLLKTIEKVLGYRVPRDYN